MMTPAMTDTSPPASPISALAIIKVPKIISNIRAIVIPRSVYKGKRRNFFTFLFYHI